MNDYQCAELDFEVPSDLCSFLWNASEPGQHLASFAIPIFRAGCTLDILRLMPAKELHTLAANVGLSTTGAELIIARRERESPPLDPLEIDMAAAELTAKRFFRWWDISGTGVLRNAELATMGAWLEAQGLSSTEEVMRMLGNAADIHAFTYWWKRSISPKLPGSALPKVEGWWSAVAITEGNADLRSANFLEAHLKTIYDAMDADGSGKISRAELKAKLKADSELEELLGKKDTAGKGFKGTIQMDRILVALNADGAGDVETATITWEEFSGALQASIKK